MRIAIATDRFEPHRGGLEQYAFDLAARLSAAGHEVHVVAFAIGADAERLPIAPHHVECGPGRAERAAAAEKCLRSLGADVIHDLGTGWYFDVFHPIFGSRIAGQRANIASAGFVDRLRLMISPSRRRRYREMRALEDRQYASRGAAIIVPSQMVKTHLVQLHGVDPSSVTVIYNGADVRRFGPEHRASHREATRARLGLKGDEVLFLLSAHNFRLKGVRTAVEATCLMAARGLPFRLAITGDGQPEPYRRIASARGAEQHVTFCGFTDDQVPYYAAADAYVLPTFYDTCSLTVLEAWASGLPAITTRCNGASELMTPGQEGFVLDDPRDARTLAALMEKLMDESLRRRMGEAARALALQHSSDKKFREIEVLYKGLKTGRYASA